MTDQGASYNAISEITRLQKENEQLREDKTELLAELYSLVFDEGVLGNGGALPKWTATLVRPMKTAKRMWDAYTFRAGGITFDGKPLPTWDELGEDRQSCWIAAASVTADQIEKLEAALREIIDMHPFKDPEGDASVKAVVDLMFHMNLTARRALNTSQERVKNNGET
jgi:hypothetical protein